MSDIVLEKPRKYRPFEKGVYQVAPLLRPLPSYDPSKPDAESRVFQIDENFDHYRNSKEAALKEEASKYVGESNFSPEQKRRIVDFMASKLAEEYPKLFELDNPLSQGGTLLCHHTQEKIQSSPTLELLSGPALAKDPFTALALQIQEDFSVWTYEGEKDWMAYGSILSPNHWDPREKIGQSFYAVHEPIAESGPMIKNSSKIVQMMVHKGPFLRFAWGVSTDTRLNHHPEAPPQILESEWAGRAFDPADPKLWVRSERQTLHGFPEERLSFFTIRTYFEEVSEIKKDPEAKETLKKALLSMTKRSLEYKGLSKSLDSVLDWIDAQ